MTTSKKYSSRRKKEILQREFDIEKKEQKINRKTKEQIDNEPVYYVTPDGTKKEIKK